MWELDHKEGLALKNWCFWTVVLKKTLESPLDSKEIQPVHPKGNQSWICVERTDAEAETLILWPPDGEDLTHLKRPWCWERLKAGEGDNRGWDGWMTSLTQWTWVWVNSGSWWWTGKPGMLQSMGSQRVEHDWATKLNWTEPLHWASLVAQRVKNLACNSGDLSSVPEWGRSPGEGNGNPLQYSCQGNSVDRGGWRAMVHGAANSQTWLSDWAHTKAINWWKEIWKN